MFVTVTHGITGDRGADLTDEHDIVYRAAPAPGSAPPPAKAAPAGAAWRRKVEPDPVMLFRYSALTFNGHRIHYDQPYVTQVEGYPGLIVHGPLIATLLLDLLDREQPDANVVEFSFRAVSPLFDIAPFHVCGKPGEGGAVHLWAENPDGALAMEATAKVARRSSPVELARRPRCGVPRLRADRRRAPRPWLSTAGLRLPTGAHAFAWVGGLRLRHVGPRYRRVAMPAA